MNSLEAVIRKNALTCGLLLGICLAALSIFSFYYVTQIAKTPVLFLVGPTMLSIMIPIILVVIFCFYIRKKIGGYWTLRQATTGIFIMFILAYIVQTLGKDLIFAKIEPHVAEKTEAAFEAALNSFKKQPGANAKQIDQNLADLRQNYQSQKNITIGQTIQGIATSIIFIFVIALVFGALFKREPPLYEDVVEIDSTVQ